MKEDKREKRSQHYNGKKYFGPTTTQKKQCSHDKEWWSRRELLSESQDGGQFIAAYWRSTLEMDAGDGCARKNIIWAGSLRCMLVGCHLAAKGLKK